MALLRRPVDGRATLWRVLAGVALSALVGCGSGGGDAPAVGAGPSTSTSAFRVTLDRNSLSFTFAEGIIAAPIEILTAVGSGTPPTQLYVAAVTEGSALLPDIPLTLNGMTAQARVQPRADLAAGDYSGRVLFLVCTDVNCAQHVSGSPLTVSYSVKVLPKLQATAAVAIINAETDPTKPVVGSVRIDPPAGSPAFEWTAVTTDPFIRITRASGSSGTNLEYELDWAIINSMPNDFERSGVIQLITTRPNDSGPTVIVKARKALPHVVTVMPTTLVAMRVTRVIVRGGNFDALSKVAERVQVTGGTVQSATRISDKALAVDVAAHLLGEMTIRVGNAQGTETSATRIDVVPPREYDYSSLETPGIKRSAVLDPKTHHVYAANVEAGDLQKFRCSSVGCGMDSLAMPGIFDVGMYPRGNWLVTTSRAPYNVVQRIEAESLSIGLTAPLTPMAGGGDPHIGNGIPTTSDGRAWIGVGDGVRNGISTYEFGLGTLTPFVPASSIDFPLAEGPWFSAPGNGERLLTVFGANGSPPLHYLDASIGSLRSVGPGLTFRRTSSSDAGDRVLFDTRAVHDADLQLVGTLSISPHESDYALVGGALSRDGRRAYLLGAGAVPRIFVFDTSTPSAAPLTPIGSFDAADFPSCKPGPACTVPAVIIKTAADGNTLFMVGNERFVVIPIPHVWRSAGAPLSPLQPQVRMIVWKTSN